MPKVFLPCSLVAVLLAGVLAACGSETAKPAATPAPAGLTAQILPKPAAFQLDAADANVLKTAGLHENANREDAQSARPSGICLSALRGDGTQYLLAAIVRRLVPNPPPPGAAVPINEEQLAAVRFPPCNASP